MRLSAGGVWIGLVQQSKPAIAMGASGLGLLGTMWLIIDTVHAHMEATHSARAARNTYATMLNNHDTRNALERTMWVWTKTKAGCHR